MDVGMAEPIGGCVNGCKNAWEIRECTAGLANRRVRAATSGGTQGGGSGARPFDLSRRPESWLLAPSPHAATESRPSGLPQFLPILGGSWSLGSSHMITSVPLAPQISILLPWVRGESTGPLPARPLLIYTPAGSCPGRWGGGSSAPQGLCWWERGSGRLCGGQTTGPGPSASMGCPGGQPQWCMLPLPHLPLWVSSSPLLPQFPHLGARSQSWCGVKGDGMAGGG